ncbi:unnamed protein product [Brachionus calyciflorus]|uniref:LIM zinc-binding domain-containing protein n=1 Tax=Brachionus calyciflorus TaxID=104777 RepID=A0A814B8K1_9BILA|nr:unnamed protein product [Brachionus calyciflorus]
MDNLSPRDNAILNNVNSYEIDYSPPNSNTSTLKQKYLENIKKQPVNKSYIATAAVINNNTNTYIHSNSPNLSGDSGFDMSGSPSSLSQTNVHVITSNIGSLSLNQPENVNLNVTNINVGTNYVPSLIATAQSVGSEKCLRCGNLVYALERIGPIKGNIYHKTCFKCHICERQLDLKTYYINTINLSDKQIYCQSHAPKSGKGVFGADNIYIHNVLNAPKLDVMQKCDNKPKANIDGSARHIMHAMHAQHLVQMGNRKDTPQMHRFPAFPLNPDKMKAREEMLKAQKLLEEKQRAEEDMLLKNFIEKRTDEEKKLEKEVKEEWENRLQQIKIQYEQDLKRKRDLKDQKDLSQRLRKEKEDLEKNMTLKRERKFEDTKRALLQMEQEATANMVMKHSEEMLKLIKTKEAEVAVSIPIGEEDVEIDIKPGKISPITPPPPRPPLRRKRDLYDDPSVFEYIDEQAINVAESEQTSYTELVDQLTFGLNTDLEKARAIFRWITVKDLNAIEFGDSLTPDTPLGLLRGIKFGTETYHTLFMRLCSYAGMHCVDIKGHSKSVGYEPGMKIQPGKFTNTWNAVLIDGEWRFVQCNWGARHLVMSKDKKLEDTNPKIQTKPSRDKIKYQYDEHYFLPDPDEFILEFFPHNIEWQLLEQPISLEEFESLPFVRSLFFHYHLDFLNQRQAVIFTNSRGACDIKLRMPEDLKSRLAFHFHLRVANREENEINGVKLERYVLHTIQDDLVSFNVHVPQIGEYFIEIFASLVEPEANPFGQSFKLKCVCKYKIMCDELNQRMHPLPACASGEWGPMKAQRHFNIIPINYKTAIIEAQNPTLEIRFELPKTLKIHGKLHNNNISDLDKLVKHEINPNNQLELIIYVQLPDDGQYGLDIYARDPEYQSEKRTMSHCCKYLINFNRKIISALSSIDLGTSLMLGPNADLLSQLGMSPMSHTEPVVILDDVPMVDIQFKMSKAVDFSFDLKYCLINGINHQNVSNYTQIKSSDIVKVKQYGYTINFSFSLPINKYGNYLFTVYASDDQLRVKNLPAVFTYLLRYEKKYANNSNGGITSNSASSLSSYASQSQSPRYIK